MALRCIERHGQRVMMSPTLVTRSCYYPLALLRLSALRGKRHRL